MIGYDVDPETLQEILGTRPRSRPSWTLCWRSHRRPRRWRPWRGTSRSATRRGRCAGSTSPNGTGRPCWLGSGYAHVLQWQRIEVATDRIAARPYRSLGSAGAEFVAALCALPLSTR